MKCLTILCYCLYGMMTEDVDFKGSDVIVEFTTTDLNVFSIDEISDICWYVYNKDIGLFTEAFNGILYSYIHDESVIVYELLSIERNELHDTYHNFCYPDSEQSQLFFNSTHIQQLHSMDKYQFLHDLLDKILELAHMPNCEDCIIYKSATFKRLDSYHKALMKYQPIFKFSVQDLPVYKVDYCCDETSQSCCITCCSSRQKFFSENRHIYSLYHKNSLTFEKIAEKINHSMSSRMIADYILQKILYEMFNNYKQSLERTIYVFGEEEPCSMCSISHIKYNSLPDVPDIVFNIQNIPAAAEMV